MGRAIQRPPRNRPALCPCSINPLTGKAGSSMGVRSMSNVLCSATFTTLSLLLLLCLYPGPLGRSKRCSPDSTSMAGPAPSKTSFPKTFSRWCPLLQHRNQNEGGYDGIRLKDKASKFREKHSTRERILRRSLFSKVLRRFPRMNKLMSLVRNGAGELIPPAVAPTTLPITAPRFVFTVDPVLEHPATANPTAAVNRIANVLLIVFLRFSRVSRRVMSETTAMGFYSSASSQKRTAFPRPHRACRWEPSVQFRKDAISASAATTPAAQSEAERARARRNPAATAAMHNPLLAATYNNAMRRS